MHLPIKGIYNYMHIKNHVIHVKFWLNDSSLSDSVQYYYMAEFAIGLDEVNPICLIGYPSSRQDGPILPT